VVFERLNQKKKEKQTFQKTHNQPRSAPWRNGSVVNRDKMRTTNGWMDGWMDKMDGPAAPFLLPSVPPIPLVNHSQTIPKLLATFFTKAPI
jgi:hypothetical protein